MVFRASFLLCLALLTVCSVAPEEPITYAPISHVEEESYQDSLVEDSEEYTDALSVLPFLDMPEIIVEEASVEDEELINIYEYVSEEEIIMLAKTCYGEARGQESMQEKAAVIWCVLNRVDSEGYGFGKSISYVINFPHQFQGYRASHPVEEELYDLSVDVVTRWIREKQGEESVGRVLPADYLWFLGDYEKNPQDAHNYFRNKYADYDSSNIWDWSLVDPYVSD